VKKLTKKARKETVQAIVDRYAIGEAFSADDLTLFNEMCGTSWEGAKHMRNTEYPSDPRHVHVLKGKIWEAFSWNKAISPITDWTELCRTMRALAAEIAEQYLDETSETECAYSDRGGCNGPLQADHCGVPFDDIAKAFVNEHGTPELVDGPPGGGRIFKSMDMEAAWIAFHAQRAVYQLLCRSHNASKGKRHD
jgi:hypothetical protein